MSVQPIIPGLWQVAIRYVNAFILDGGDGLTVVDAGPPGGEAEILAAIAAIGRAPADVARIVATHCHSDHVGGLAALKRATAAPAFMHPIDAAMTREGRALRPLVPAPGLLNRLVRRFLLPDAPTEVEPTTIEREVADGEALPGGLRAVHVPGHCAGQIALRWPDRGALIVADAAANAFGLALSPMYEDVDEGRRGLAKLAMLDFEVAVFGHGKPIMRGASAAFRRKWGPAEAPR